MASEVVSSEAHRTGYDEGETIFLANSKGNGFNVFLFDGVYHCVYPDEMLNGEKHTYKLKKLKETKLEDDDIIICAYPKCGTHWLWEIMEMLRSGVIKYQKEPKEARMLEVIFKEGLEAIPPPRIINTHLPLRMLPKQIGEKKIKCVHVMRNPKDVCVSYFHHLRNEAPPFGYDGDFIEFTEAFLSGKIYCGSYSEYLFDWTTEVAQIPDLPALNLHYEDMKRDPVGCVRQLADFLNLSVTDKFCEDIADACSFKKMKKMDAEIKEGKIDVWKEGSEGTFYRKGETGDWKNWFTVAESEKFDQIWNEKMKNSGITFTYSLVS